MVTERYYSKMLKRAWQDTKGFFGWNKKSLVFLLLYAVGLLLYWVLQGVEAVKEEILFFLAFGLAPIGGFAILLFLWNSLRAPIRMEKQTKESHKEQVDELNTELEGVKQRVQLLEDERIPCIEAKPIAGRREWDWEHEHLMWAELEVTNTSSSQPLNDVGVRIAKCISVQPKQDAPDQYVLIDFPSWNPVSVYWSERNAPKSQLRTSLSPSETKTALVAFQDNSNGVTSVFNAPTHPLRIGGAKIEIEISSLNSALWKGSFYIECTPHWLRGPQATFEFVKWEDWKANHHIVPLNLGKGDSEAG